MSKNEKDVSKYEQIILKIFFDHWKNGEPEFTFDRDEIHEAADSIGISRIKNPGDLIYSYRYRRQLPEKILNTQPNGLNWLILGAGDAKYRFRLNKLVYVTPTTGLLARKIPNATPEIISKYALSDEQALLASLRYNRLIDIFLGITTFSLQNHLRTKIPNYGQIEIDELYIGLDSSGAQYIIPVQAKGGSDQIGAIQTIQDHIYCSSDKKYEGCLVRTVSAQFLSSDEIALFELTFDGNEVSIIQEKHFRLVPASEISIEELKEYKIHGSGQRF